MKKLVFIFLIISSAVFAQDVNVVNATMKTVNHSTSSTSSITYTITLNKIKRSKWKIDSLINVSSGQPVKYTIIKVDDPGAASPKYEKVNYFSKSDLGTFQITFEMSNIEKGVYLYLTTKNKHKRFKIDEFEKLETIDAP